MSIIEIVGTIEFVPALNHAAERSRGTDVTGTTLTKGLGPKEVQLLYDVPAQGSLDGNTVDLDVQRAKFAENAIMYEFAVEKVSEKHMMDLLKNLPY